MVSTHDPRELLDQYPFTVLFSGGKDSLAVLLWVLDNVEHERWDVLYVEVTGNTSALCNQYVHEVIDELGLKHRFRHVRREDLDFFECVKKWGIPVIGFSRWCLSEFKMRLFEKYAKPIQVTGVKRTDSHRRRNVKLVDYLEMSRSITVQPILDWSTRQVLDYIRRRNVAVNPCYELYGHSGNCMLCPYHRREAIVKTMRDPEWRQKILDALTHARGRISRSLARKWLAYAQQQTLPFTA